MKFTIFGVIYRISAIKNGKGVCATKKQGLKFVASLHRRGKLGSAVLYGAATAVVCGLLVTLLSHTKSPARFEASETALQPFVYLETAGGSYLGPMENGQYIGTGTFEYYNGGTYTGSFVNSMRDGDGIFTWANGDSFQGTWKKDKMVEGTYMFANHRQYVGEFIDNLFTNGVFVLGSSALEAGYTGFSAVISDGVMTELTMTTTTGFSFQGQLNGQANIRYSSGNQYSGAVTSGQRNGMGEFVWYSDGERRASYNGSWQNGVMQGDGTYHYNGTLYPYLTGVFEAGKPNGTITYFTNYEDEGAENASANTWNISSSASLRRDVRTPDADVPIDASNLLAPHRVPPDTTPLTET